MMTAARACVPSLRFAAARPRTWVLFAPVIARDVAKASWRSAEPPATETGQKILRYALFEHPAWRDRGPSGIIVMLAEELKKS